jgi:hypothetical protein
MKIFTDLLNLIELERKYLPFIESLEDRDIATSIGHHEFNEGEPLTLKHLSQLEIGSIATIHRRITRMIELGIIVKRRDKTDGRVFTLHLSSTAKRAYQNIELELAV